METFLTSWSNLYPCKHCAAHMRDCMEDDPPRLQSRDVCEAVCGCASLCPRPRPRATGSRHASDVRQGLRVMFGIARDAQ